jgi:hypothetical protein
MNITRSDAEFAAKRLVERRRTKERKLKEAFSNKVADLYEKHVVPAYVLAVCDKEPYKDYLNKTSSIYVNGCGCGFSNTRVALHNNRSVVYSKVGSANLNLNTLPEKDCSGLDKDYNHIKAYRVATDKIEHQIKNTLYTLRTLKKIEVSFPEALPYLPTESNNLPSVNLKEIREILNA